MQANGIVAGVPTAGGTFNFTVTATDSSPFPGPFSGSRAYTIVIADGEIVLPPDTLPDGTLGVAYHRRYRPRQRCHCAVHLRRQRGCAAGRSDAQCVDRRRSPARPPRSAPSTSASPRPIAAPAPGRTTAPQNYSIDDHRHPAGGEQFVADRGLQRGSDECAAEPHWRCADIARDRHRAVARHRDRQRQRRSPTSRPPVTPARIASPTPRPTVAALRRRPRSRSRCRIR